jgi:enoyl-[acyl-carrier protein] reductase I
MLDLTGKNALVTGIANNRSIAWGIAQQLHAAGANLGVTYLPDDKGQDGKEGQGSGGASDPQPVLAL